MKVIVGDETGLLKLVDLQSKQYAFYGEQSRHLGVVGMSWFSRDLLSVLRLNGAVELWRYSSGSGDNAAAMEVAAMSSQILEGSTALGLHSCGDDRLLAVGNGGVAKVLVRAEDELLVDSELALSAPVSCSILGEQSLVFGGKENDLEVWDLATKTQTWKAKNVKQDNLSLRVPVWPTAVDFFHEKESGQLNMLVMGSGHKHVRLYDTRTQRRPVSSMEVEDFRVTSIASLHDDKTVLVGNTAGDCFAVDVRNMAKLYPLKGGAGSIRQLHVTSDNNYASTVGLDRWLRVYSVRTHKVVGQCYLKNRINCSLFTEDITIAGDRKHDDEEDGLGETIPYDDMGGDDDAENEDGSEDSVEELSMSGDEDGEENDDSGDDDYELSGEDDAEDESSEEEPSPRRGKRSPKKQSPQTNNKRAKGGKGR